MTLTVTSQEAKGGGIVAPESVTLPPFAVAVTLTGPPQVVAAAGVPVLTMFIGYVSVKVTPLKDTASLLLTSLMVSRLGSLGEMALGEKDFKTDRVGIVRVAAADEELLPPLLETAFAGMVLV